jgi:hypothetical protein
MISIREGMDLAEREAWRSKGKEHAGFFIWGRRLIPVALIGAPLAAIGYGLYRLWNLAAGWFGGEETVPSAVAHAGSAPLLVAGAVLAALTVIAMRVDYRRFSVVAMTSVGFVIAWSFLIGYGISTLG